MAREAARRSGTTRPGTFPKLTLSLFPATPTANRAPASTPMLSGCGDTYVIAGHIDVVLAGHSLGGAIALLYALKYPEDLEGLILIGSGARLRVGTMYLEMLEQAKSNRSIFEDFFHKSYEFIEPELRDVLQRKALESDPAVLLNDMLCCDRFDIMDRVHEIKLPTLALCGSEDIMTPPKYTKYLASKIEGAREVIIEGGTHMVFAEQPMVVNQAIEDYLNSL